jgi:hypothetical protein
VSGLERWRTGDEVAPGLHARFLIAGTSALAERSADVSRFLTAYSEATARFAQLWHDPAAVSELTGDSVAVLAEARRPGFPPGAALDRNRLDIELGLLRDAALVPADATLDQLLDLSHLETATATTAGP